MVSYAATGFLFFQNFQFQHAQILGMEILGMENSRTAAT